MNGSRKMMLNPMKNFSSLLAVLSLAACGFYQAPADISPQTTATIFGSETVLPSGDHVRVSASEVDGAGRFGAPMRSGTPFPITEGPHRLTVGVMRFGGGFVVGYGLAPSQVSLAPGAEYYL